MPVPLAERWLYRASQFFAAVGFGGRVNWADMAEARRVLGPALFGVFAALPQPYRRHGIAVYRRVREVGGDDTALLQAALLHDCGKFDPASGRQVTVWHRVAVVLLGAVEPGKAVLARLSDGRLGPFGLLYPFYLSREHPRLGAQRARQHGASPETVRLIANHQGYGGTDEMLQRLQAADDRS